MEKDFTILSVKLDIERTLLLQWAEQVRLIHKDYDPRLDNPDTKRTIARVLMSIKDLLSDGSQLENRYGMQRLKTNQPEPLMILSTHRLRQFRYDFMKLNLNDHPSVKTVDEALHSQRSNQPDADVNTDPRSRKHRATIKEKFCWAVRDKDKFTNLIQHISDLVRGLNTIVPLKQSASVDLLHQDVQQVERISRLELLMDVAKDHRQIDSFTGIIQAQIDQRYQQQILDSLWYRMLDHRRNSVSEAHPGTFDWALDPPTEKVEWDNLSKWLQSGSGIYWIHGKPGSGKSTLMKYLYDSSFTRSLLSKWAEDEPLWMPHFFFWNLGTVEQKTQYGLYRGLLYHILKDNPSLIPDLLPEMWREAHKDGGPTGRTSLETQASNLDPPTEEEMMLAFPRLKAHTRAAFCFFIDGLDEYSGDPFRLITFLEKLVSDNIKAVVSSRPIPSCFQAFSQGPQLRLQDLTRNDIKTYVHDTIALHPHIETITGMDSTIVDRIQGELTAKASGVFLWVVLACRSLIQGFAAFDTPEELQQRLEELPPELNDLFEHILQKFDRRYQEQAAKLLYLCYHSTNLKNSPYYPHKALFTLGLALADADNLDTTKPFQYKQFSQDEKINKCKQLEARLRSRCCGLLEIQFGCSRLSHCLCQSDPHPPRKHSNCKIVGSTVDFIHRTVFEFLKSPGMWANEYLQISDKRFYPDAILSRVNAHLILVSIQGNFEDDAFNCIFESLLHLQVMDFQLGNESTGSRRPALPRALLEIAKLLKMLISKEPMEGSRTSGRSDYLRLHFRTSKNGCPDLVAKLVCELAMKTTFQQMDISRYGDQSSPLLYHVIEKPLLRKLFGNGFQRPRLNINEVIARGYDVNEYFVEYTHGRPTTPWIHWLGQPSSDVYEMALEDSWATEEFLRAGADVSGVENRFNTPITTLVGQRILGDTLEESDIDEEDGGFNRSHPFFEEDLKDECLRSSYECVRRLLRDSARQREENFRADSVSAVSESPESGCDGASNLKRRCGESIQDDESEYSSASGSLQTKRQRICAQVDTEMGTQELT